MEELNFVDMWFQQDGATCHTARDSMAILRENFGQQFISRNGPSSRSRSSQACGYALAGPFTGLEPHRKSVGYDDAPGIEQQKREDHSSTGLSC
ncbi:hypothetical protein JYU34_015196 [Plutella xylostella]|uniref:Transposase n=1 Tax=Plutella xylostella TaxID=51655 RepID=A0ABQ7Q7Y8_PLUXY|nr:hypothetical protein JYU34_015196 [Plutella xylostella]